MSEKAWISLTCAISMVKWFFWGNFCIRQYFLLFFAEFELLVFHNIIMYISKKLNQLNIEKLPSSYLPYRFLHNVHQLSLGGEGGGGGGGGKVKLWFF